MQVARVSLIAGIILSSVWPLSAQIDPVKRELIQLGYNQPIQGKAPLSGYAFYYVNVPHFVRTNLTLRLAVAPVYLDSEVGLSQVLGPNTDLAFGMAGGGFADSYAEVRGGRYLKDESFIGHGGEVSSSIYHRFNPGSRIPLNGVLRLGAQYQAFQTDDDTDPMFSLPNSGATVSFRSGIRWGGMEPLILPEVAMELSLWEETMIRGWAGSYGFPMEDPGRRVEEHSHRFWGRALLAYTLPESKHRFNVSVTAGTTVNPDRFSAYRLGGLLPLVSEFPLALPGYYFQEISARQFALMTGTYALPLDPAKQWSLGVTASTAAVDYLKGLEQPGSWHSGVGAGITYRSSSDAWQVLLGYSYGIDALRNGERGAHAIGFLVQIDLDRAKMPLFEAGDNPIRSRGLQRILNRF